MTQEPAASVQTWWTRLRVQAPWRRSLLARLTLATLSVAAVAVLAVTWASYQQATSALRERLVEQLQGVADARSADLQRWLQAQRRVVEYAARSPGFGAAATRLASASDAEATRRATADVGAELAALREGPLAAAEVQLIATPGAQVLASTDAASVGQYLAVEERYYLEGRTRTFVQNVYPSPSGRPALTVATPVRGADGRTVGVLVAHLDLTQVDALLHGREGGVPIESYAVNKYSEYVSAAVFGRAGFQRGIHSLGIDRALRKTTGAGEYSNFRGEPVIGVWRWLADYELALLVESPRAAAFAPARKLLLLALGLSLFGLVLLGLGLTAATRRITRPVLATAAAAERVARGDFTARAPDGADDEVGRLARTFNGMAHELHALYDQLQAQVATTGEALADAQASRSLLQDIIDNTNTGVGVLDQRGQLLLANRRFDETFARMVPSAGSAAGEINLALANAIELSRARHETVEREIVVSGAPESHTWLVSCFPLRDTAQQPYATGVIATDLTERARVEEERRHTDATVQHAQKLESLGIMAGGIAHDFNNILGAVLGNADLALAHADDPDEVRAALEQIVAASRRAADLTRQMLAYAGKSSFRREVLDLNALVREIVPLVRMAQSKKALFVVEGSPEPAWIEADVAQMSQVVLNLVTNAAESIGDVQGAVTVTVEAATAPPPAGPGVAEAAVWHRVVVRDTGQGMDEATRRRIFEPFFTTKQSGRGLGLSAVTGIVRSAGGAIEVQSIVGHGTTVAVHFVAASSPAEPVTAQVPVVNGKASGTVLVIDDEEALRRVCRRSLERAGFRVLDAADGAAGVRVFAEAADAVDVMVLDLTMPGMNGGEVLQEVRRTHPLLPVIIASGYDAADAAIALPEDPHLRFLQKPYKLQTLVGMVRDFAAAGRAARTAAT